MAQKIVLPLLAIVTLALPGCVASIAASAIGAAARSAQSRQQAKQEPLVPQAAVAACTEYATQYGTVGIIDVENRSRALVVWGTVTSDQERQSFECRYSGRIADFKLRQIPNR